MDIRAYWLAVSAFVVFYIMFFLDLFSHIR